MSNQLSPELLLQLFKQESNDPLLSLLTLSHPSFSTIRLVNNTKDVVSRGDTYSAFPFTLSLPIDDGETNRQVSIEFDNVGLTLIEPIRSVITPINVKLELILASLPNSVQMSLEELKIYDITYNRKTISATLLIDTFLYTDLTSETYTPQNFPGIF